MSKMLAHGPQDHVKRCSVLRVVLLPMWGPDQQICSLLYLVLQPRGDHVLGMLGKPFSIPAPGFNHHIFWIRVAQVMAHKVCLEWVREEMQVGRGNRVSLLVSALCWFTPPTSQWHRHSPHLA